MINDGTIAGDPGRRDSRALYCQNKRLVSMDQLPGGQSSFCRYLTSPVIPGQRQMSSQYRDSAAAPRPHPGPGEILDRSRAVLQKYTESVIHRESRCAEGEEP